MSTLPLLLLLAAADPATEVRSFVQEQVAAWNRGDLETFCAAYADDAIFLSPSGVTRGRAEVLARYRKRYPDATARGTLTIEPLEVRTFEGGASVAARWRIARKDQPEASGLTLVVLRRTAEGLAIVQDASM